MECSICLNNMKPNEIIFILSCDHKLHYQCFIRYVFSKGHIFIQCPLCRKMNLNDKKPSDDIKENLKMICSLGGSKRCCAINITNGKRCKKKSSILNYGFCSIHHKDILPKCKYEIMSIYLFYIIQTNNSWYTKVYLIDIVKKLLIRYPEINKLEEIHYYMLRFKFHQFEDENIIQSSSMYEYYYLLTPPIEWTRKCIEKRVIY